MSMDPNRWINTLPKMKTSFSQDDHSLNVDKWIDSLPKKKLNNTIRNYSIVGAFFIFGLVLVSAIKNETRILQKEINNLQVSISKIKLNLHKAVLDHEVITSPQNISNLAKEHLEDNFIFYTKSQIKQLGDKKISVTKVKEKKFIKKNDKEIKNYAKLSTAKKIKVNNTQLKKLKEIYLRPEKLPKKIKFEVVNKIEKTKFKLKKLYSSPADVIDPEKIKKWAGIQVVKAFLGIPIIPGR